MTAPDAWRKQAADNKQGSAGYFSPEEGAVLSAEESELHQYCCKVYNAHIDKGVAREQARKDLPLSTYTQAYWKIDLHNLLHFLALRMEAHAQQEIRDYAATIGKEIVQRWVPLTWEAFMDYRFNAVTLSRDMQELLGMIARGEAPAARAYAEGHGLMKLDKKTNALKPGREIRELEAILATMRLPSPWK